MTEAEHQGVVAQVARIGDSLIRALPPAFLLLILINAAFLGMVMWFVDNQSAQRNAMVSVLLNRCMEIAYHATPDGGK